MISGRVVNRHGKPLANVEVFQSGDGPERTTTRTDGDGRFALGGFNQGPVFLLRGVRGFASSVDWSSPAMETSWLS